MEEREWGWQRKEKNTCFCFHKRVKTRGEEERKKREVTIIDLYKRLNVCV